jgi:hypothetical protein
VYAGIGDRRRVAEIVDELLQTVGSRSDLGWSVVVSPELAWLAGAVGRGDEFRALLAREQKYTRWLDAAEAIVEGDLRRAAEVLGECGARPIEAFCQLRAAEALVAEGRRAEADEQLRPALAFYRGVGATRYVREGEALMAATA